MEMQVSNHKTGADDDQALLNELWAFYVEGMGHAQDYSRRARESRPMSGSVHFHELDARTWLTMFKDMKDNPDGRAALTLAIRYIYGMTPPK